MNEQPDIPPERQRFYSTSVDGFLKCNTETLLLSSDYHCYTTAVRARATKDLQVYAVRAGAPDVIERIAAGSDPADENNVQTALSALVDLLEVLWDWAELYVRVNDQTKGYVNASAGLDEALEDGDLKNGKLVALYSTRHATPEPSSGKPATPWQRQPGNGSHQERAARFVIRWFETAAEEILNGPQLPQCVHVGWTDRRGNDPVGQLRRLANSSNTDVFFVKRKDPHAQGRPTDEGNF